MASGCRWVAMVALTDEREADRRQGEYEERVLGWGGHLSLGIFLLFRLDGLWSCSIM